MRHLGSSRLLVCCLSLCTVLASEAATISVGGRTVEMPKDTAEEHERLISAIGIYDDPELAEYVDRIGQRLVAHSATPKKTFTFTLLDSPDINAFALPGGAIYVNRGLLAYLDNEAELAGVLAHEIGHVTENHHGRRKTQSATSTVLSTAAYILTGSGDLYDASRMYGAELISGFGRDMELEADSAGAETLHRAGYDVDAMLSVIGVLKDQEMYRRVAAKSSGKPSGSYHGLYASHPRNDLRLQTVIRAANDLPLSEQPEDPRIPGEFRQQTNGLVFGASAQARSEPNRYWHNKLDFSFAYPEGWRVQQLARTIVASAADGSAKVTIKLAKVDPAIDPGQYIKDNGGGTVNDERELEQFGLKGATALVDSGGVRKRLAVIDHRYRFLFEGEATDPDSHDAEFLTVMESFRPLVAKEKSVGDSRTLHYIQVPRGATFASLATSARIPDAENQLRLINGYYPNGEPRTGDWIKVIR